jgi:gliding motility associated protien GldN
MKKGILIVILCLACAACFAQTPKKPRRKPKPNNRAKVDTTNATRSARPPQLIADTSKKMAAKPTKPFDRPLDGYYKKSNILNAKVTPYPSLRESDVAYAKRVWREIDLREKMNAYLISPKQRLIDVLVAAIKDGELTAYDATQDDNNKDDPDGDAFSKPLTTEQAMRQLSDSVTRKSFDANNNETDTKVLSPFVADSVIKFRIKEDWIFDKQRSVFEPRIIGIAPLIHRQAAGTYLDYQPAFWIYFPDARPILAVKEVVSKDNDNTGLSFDDIFMKRIFTSYIVKVSNDKDESIKDHAQGIDKLYEAEQIKKKLQDWEVNLWQY